MIWGRFSLSPEACAYISALPKCTLRIQTIQFIFSLTHSILYLAVLTQLFQIHMQPGFLYSQSDWGGHAAPKSVPLWNTSKKNFSWLSWLTLLQSVGASEAASLGLFHSFVGYSRHRTDPCWSEATRHGWVSLRNQLSVWQFSQRPGGQWDGTAGVWL